MSTDAELLQRYATEKSEPAFAELVQRHLSLVYSAALRHVGGDVHLAQDVTQTVFTALARKASSLTARPALAGWLYLSAHHAAAQWVRSDRRRQVREQEAQAMQEILAPSTPPADWDRVRPVIDDALRELNAADREAVLLRYFQRRPFAEIGATLHLTEDAARMRVERALEKLRLRLERRGITSTTAVLATVFANQAMVAAPAGLAATVASGAVAAAAGATGIFMSTSLAVLSAVALAAIGSTVYEVNQAHRADAATAALRQERDTLGARVLDLQRTASVSESHVAALQADVATLRAGRASAPTAVQAAAAPGATPTTAESKNTEVAMLKKVAAEIESRRKNRTEMFDLNNQALYRIAGFSPGQAAQYKALTFEYWAGQDQLVKTAVAQGLKATDAVFQPVTDRLNSDYEAKLRASFGDAGYTAIKDFNDTNPVRQMVVNQFANRLFYSDTPLTPAQAEQVIAITAANMRNAQGSLDFKALNPDPIVLQASGVLSAPQLDAWRQFVGQLAADGQRARTEVTAEKQTVERATLERKPSGG